MLKINLYFYFSPKIRASDIWRAESQHIEDLQDLQRHYQLKITMKRTPSDPYPFNFEGSRNDSQLKMKFKVHNKLHGMLKIYTFLKMAFIIAKSSYKPLKFPYKLIKKLLPMVRIVARQQFICQAYGHCC